MTPQDWVNVVFLTLLVWRESRGQEWKAQYAVACSVMDRVKNPGWWGHDVQSVVFKPWQYSSLTAKKDPQLSTWPENAADSSWVSCLTFARAAYDGGVNNPAPDADSYYDVSIPAPSWAHPQLFVIQIGKLRFYNLKPTQKLGLAMQ